MKINNLGNNAWIVPVMALASSLMVNPSALAQVQTSWIAQHHPSASSSDRVAAVKTDSQNNVVITGMQTDAISGNTSTYTAKYAAATGALLWEKSRDGNPDDGDTPFGPSEGISGLAIDESDNVIVTGRSVADGEQTEMFTAKYSSAGILLWESIQSGADGAAVSVDSVGNILVTGSREDNDALPLGYTVKYSGITGQIIWESLDGSDKKSLVVDKNNNIFVTGYYETIKYAAADGALLWKSDGYFDHIALDPDGNLIVTGTKFIYSDELGSFTALYSKKLNGRTGATLWQRLGPRINSLSAALCIDTAGNAVITGTVGSRYYTAKYKGSNGVILWEKYYNGPGTGADYASGLVLDKHDNAIVTGSSENQAGNFDYFTMGYAAGNGAVLGSARYDDASHGDNTATAIAIDKTGKIIVTGNSPETLGGSTALTIKYQP